MSRIAEAFLGDTPYPQSPGFKEPTTSRDAAVAISSKASTLRERAYAALKAAGPTGLTADETAAKLGESILAVRPRLSELRAEGRATPTNERRHNASGLKARVWIAP